MKNAIKVSGLCKSYRDFSLQDVSFTLPAGSIMGFIGENGAGKTTTIKAILGLIHTDAGQLEVLGHNMQQSPDSLKQELGVVLDGSFFYEGVRPKDIDKVMSCLQPGWDSNLFSQYCRRFSLPVQKPFKEYSTGMRAKLMLITALSHRPKLLILDEATSGLDPVVRSDILDLFLEFIQDEQHSILLSSHITSDLEKVADYITFIHEGRIIFSESKDEMQRKYGLIKCTKEDVRRLDASHILGRRDSAFDVQLLVDNREDTAARFPSLLMERADIDEIMTFFVKGVQNV